MDDLDSLLRRSQAGDIHAFEALARTWVDRLHALAWRTTGDRTRADDVVQEVFLRVASGRARYEGRGSAAGWLLRVTARAALDERRSEASRSQRERRAGMARVRVHEHGGGDRTDDETRTALEQALEELAPLTRTCVWLGVVEGLGVREIGAIVGKGRSATAERIRRGLEGLRAGLGRRGVSLDAVAFASVLGASGLTASGREALLGRVLAAVAQTPPAVAPVPSSSRTPRSARLALAAAVVSFVVCGLAIWHHHPRGLATLPAPETGSTVVSDGPQRTHSLPALDAAPAPETTAPAHEPIAGPEPAAPATLVVYTVDEAGEPVADAVVVLQTMVRKGRSRAWGSLGQPVEHHCTDGAGVLVLEDFAPGRYEVSGRTWTRSGQGPPYIDVAEGEEGEVILVLSARPHVLGRAYYGPTGVVLANAELELVGRRWESAIPTDSEGRFVFGPVSSRGGFFQLRYRDSRVVTVPLEPPGATPQEVEVVFLPGVAVAGKVRNPADQPLPEIEVTWQRENTPEKERLRSVTDAEGRYELPGLEPGLWLARVEATGYHSEEDVWEETVPEVSLHEVSFVVDCLPELEVRAVLASGEPVPGIELRLAGRRPFVSFGLGVDGLFTDAQGRVAVRNVWRDARLTVAVEDPRYRAAPLIREVAAIDGPLVFGVEAVAAVQGTVVDSSGRPLSGVLVHVQEGDGDDRHTVRWGRTDDAGRFEVAIGEPGKYRLLVMEGERGAGEVFTRIEPGGAVDEDLLLRVDPARSLRARVLDPRGEPARARVTFLRLDRDAPAVADTEPAEPASGALEADTDERGWCAVPAEPGRYAVEAHRSDADGSHAAVGPTMQPGDRAPTLELVELPPLVEGVVLHEGEPVPGAGLTYGRGDGPNIGGAEADPSGRFAFHDLRGWSDGDTLVFYASGPGFAIARSEAVPLEAGATAKVTVRSLPGEDLAVRVVDESGAPVARAEVEVHAHETPPVHVELVTDDAGAVRVPRLPAGRYWYRVSSADRTRAGYGDLLWPDERPASGAAAALVWTIAPAR